MTSLLVLGHTCARNLLCTSWMLITLFNSPECYEGLSELGLCWKDRAKRDGGNDGNYRLAWNWPARQRSMCRERAKREAWNAFGTHSPTQTSFPGGRKMRDPGNKVALTPLHPFSLHDCHADCTKLYLAILNISSSFAETRLTAFSLWKPESIQLLHIRQALPCFIMDLNCVSFRHGAYSKGV